jgi:6-pyruvoyltetrahydropterin/6-carboxytetrahydropterin synthase
MKPVYRLKVIQSFSAAHFLRDYEGPCARMHGHDYKVEVEIASHTLLPNGLAIDASDIKRELEKLIAYVDHRCLNDLPPFTEMNPSAENIAGWFFEELTRVFSNDSRLWVEAIVIHETEKFSVRYSLSAPVLV